MHYAVHLLKADVKVKHNIVILLRSYHYTISKYDRFQLYTIVKNTLKKQAIFNSIVMKYFPTVYMMKEKSTG